MTTSVEYVREECKKRNVAIAQLEKDLGFSNGYLNPKKLHKIPYDRARMIAGYLGINLNRILGISDDVEESQQQEYYLDDETVSIAESIAMNPELKQLYEAQRGLDTDDLKAMYSMALALKRKSERLDSDDPA